MSRYPDGIDPGRELGSRELVLTPDWIEKYMGSIDARHPWYTDDSPFGGAIAPAAVLNYEMEMFPGWHPPEVGHDILNTGQVWEFRRPMRPGQRVILSARIHSREQKRGRDYVSVEACAHDTEGNLLCRTITTHAWKTVQPRGGAGE